MRPGFVHTVFFWLRSDLNTDDKLAFQQGVNELKKCPTVQEVFIGPPAETDRSVVDNSYDVALLVFFANKDDHDAYQEDEKHHAFIDQFNDCWTRVQVYDYLPSE